MKTTEQLISENIARFQATCKQIDSKLIENAELIATRREVLDSNITTIRSTEEILNSLRNQYKTNKS
jgi:hypothetical protein